MKKYLPIILVALIFGTIGLVGGYYLGYTKSSDLVNIESFEECAAAGYPIMESYPERCITPDKRIFVRDIGDQIACTMDAKICPDGSSVGRIAPNCEFAPCPGE